jgi:hypothetical protein
VTTLQEDQHLGSIQEMSETFKYKLAHDVLDSNGTETGEIESEDFEITEPPQSRMDSTSRTTLHA